MSYKWRDFSILRFFGLDLKTNVLDVLDGKSLDADNVYVDGAGVVVKRPGTAVMFDFDESSSTPIDELGTCTILGTKYFFKFADGKFKYATSLTGAVTTLTPSPAIAANPQVFWSVLDNKLFFVDGTNDLRYFDGTQIKTSLIYARPTIPPTSSSGAGTLTYLYTVDNGLGESPGSPILASKVSSATIRVPGNTGPQTLVAGDVVRVYSRADTIAAASILVITPYTWQAADVTAGFHDFTTDPISDANPQLYTELGLAPNKSAPTALTGITDHYGRLVGWKGSTVYNSKSTNVHSFPDDSASSNAFQYTFFDGDGETITRCKSYRETLVVTKPSNVAIFGGVGPDDTGGNAYSFRRLETHGKGCIAPKSVATVGEEGKTFLIYLSTSGFMATDGSNPTSVGEEIQNVIRAMTPTTLALSAGAYDKRLGLYYCAVGGVGAKTIYVLDTRRETVAGQSILFGWLKWSGIHANSMWFDDRMLFGTHNGVCLSQRIAGTSSDFRDVRQEALLAAAINTTSNVLTVTQSYATGDSIVIRTLDTIPAGLTANVTYFVIRISATEIQLATSQANALLGTAIDITTQGVGPHSLVSAKPIDAFYSTNWINFKKPMLVKKLGKPGIAFNALASQVNLTVSTAYNWVSQFQHSKTIIGGANDPWGSLPWGSFVWAGGSVSKPVNYGLPRRKIRSIRFKFQNSVLDQDFNLQALHLPFDYIRNRGNFAP